MENWITSAVSICRPSRLIHADRRLLGVGLPPPRRRLGQRVEALTAIDRAVSIFRPLATEWPDAFRARLADVVHTSHTELAELGQRE